MFGATFLLLNSVDSPKTSPKQRNSRMHSTYSKVFFFLNTTTRREPETHTRERRGTCVRKGKNQMSR